MPILAVCMHCWSVDPDNFPIRDCSPRTKFAMKASFYSIDFYQFEGVQPNFNLKIFRSVSWEELTSADPCFPTKGLSPFFKKGCSIYLVRIIMTARSLDRQCTFLLWFKLQEPHSKVNRKLILVAPIWGRFRKAELVVLFRETHTSMVF